MIADRITLIIRLAGVMRDECPKCEGELLLLENSTTIYCMDCAWLISIEHWNEWNTLKEMDL